MPLSRFLDVAVVGAFGDDDAGSESGSAYVYTVFTPEQQTTALIDDVLDLVDSGVLLSGPANGLIAKLDGVLKKLDKGNVGPAINQLGAFINQVQGLINAGKLPPAEGQALIDAAQSIIDELSG